jgi:hypothetical protein
VTLFRRRRRERRLPENTARRAAWDEERVAEAADRARASAAVEEADRRVAAVQGRLHQLDQMVRVIKRGQ